MAIKFFDNLRVIKRDNYTGTYKTLGLIESIIKRAQGKVSTRRHSIKSINERAAIPKGENTSPITESLNHQEPVKKHEHGHRHHSKHVVIVRKSDYLPYEKKLGPVTSFFVRLFQGHKVKGREPLIEEVNKETGHI